MSDTAPQQLVERSNDFTDRYANNINFESTAWDLRLTFGHIDQATNQLVVKQDFAVTIPWPQAKLALFYLRLHVETAEAELGVKIPIRKDLIPPEVLNLEGMQDTDPATIRLRALWGKIRAEFLAML